MLNNQSEVTEVKKQQQVTAEEEPKCCCGCGYKGTTIALAVLNGIAMLCCWTNNPFAIFYCACFINPLFILYVFLAFNEPTAGIAPLAYAVAILNTVKAVIRYLIAGFSWLSVIFVIFDSKTADAAVAQWNPKNHQVLLSFVKKHGKQKGVLLIILVFAVGFSLLGWFSQYIAGRFYAFEEYLRKKEEEKNNVAEGHDL